MTRVLAVAGVGVIALILQSVIGYQLVGRRSLVDLPLVVVVSGAIFLGPTIGLLAGTVTGLSQDALSGGILGVAGLAKTLVGFIAGVMATQFIVSALLPRFVVFMTMTWVHGICFVGVYAMIERAGLGNPWRGLLVQSLLNAVVGVVATRVVERGPEMWRRGRHRPRSERRRFSR